MQSGRGLARVLRSGCGLARAVRASCSFAKDSERLRQKTGHDSTEQVIPKLSVHLSSFPLKWS
jgi:hypothetical protein